MKKIDPSLRRTLRNFTRSYLLKRETTLQGMDFETMRAELAEVKDKVLERNEDYLNQFEAAALKKGNHVYRVRDGAEANWIIWEILKEHRAKLLVKGKSMVSEETRLNDELTRKGMVVRETDLGEWILQLAGELPTHMVMPAIHLSRREVAQVFSRTLGGKFSEEIPSLVRVAREELRRVIFKADAGLTGANALIAENGSVLLVTNEGNGRLVSAIPPVHIVLASIEKVLPTIADAFLLLELLPRSATGQPITSYVSFLSGSPNKPLHIILLDNHRSDILADPVFRKLLRCIKCSACLNVCPVYEMIGGKEFSHVYMGGIGSLLTAWIHGLTESRRLADYCLGCHRCETFCSAKIGIADLVIALKARLNEEVGKPSWKRIAFEGVMGRPLLLRAAFEVARFMRPLTTGQDGFAGEIPFLAKSGRFRSLPSPAKKPLSRLPKKELSLKKTSENRGRVALFSGCLVENFYPEVGRASVRVLQKLGYEVKLAEALCCGFPAANSGFRDAASRAFQGLRAGLLEEQYILTLCPTCTTMLGSLGPEFAGTEEASSWAQKVFPISRFLMEKEGERLKGLFSAPVLSQVITYHDSCHHKHVLKAAPASRRLLELALKKKTTEMEAADSCCGFAGFFSVTHPEVSAALLEEKLASIRHSRAEVVALDCPGCLLQIRGGFRRSRENIDVRHTIEIIEERLHKEE